MKTTLSELPSTETGVHEHRITSTVVKTKLKHVAGSQTCMHNLHRIFPVLKQVSTNIAQPLHLSKLNFSTFLVPQHAYITSTGPPRQWKRLYLIFQALKQESTSITQPLQLWKLNFSTFLGPKHTCTTSTAPPWERKRPQASHSLYSCQNWMLAHSWSRNTPA